MPVVKNIDKLKKIKILYVVPNEAPTELFVPNTLRTRRDLLNGLVSVHYLEKPNTKNGRVCLLTNGSNDKLKEANRYLEDYGIIYGNFIITVETKDGDYKSLTKEQITKYQEMFGTSSIELLNSKIKLRVSIRSLLRK